MSSDGGMGPRTFDEYSRRLWPGQAELCPAKITVNAVRYGSQEPTPMTLSCVLPKGHALHPHRVVVTWFDRAPNAPTNEDREVPL